MQRPVSGQDDNRWARLFRLILPGAIHANQEGQDKGRAGYAHGAIGGGTPPNKSGDRRDRGNDRRRGPVAPEVQKMLDDAEAAERSADNQLALILAGRR
jgi:hypothetical protein